MLDPKLVILAVLLDLVSCIPYAIDTLRGQTHPNRVSWLLWTLIPLIAFAAEVQEGVRWQSLMTFAVGFGPLIVLIASLFTKNSRWKMTRTSLVCGTLSFLAILVWQVTGKGDLAIAFSIIADGLAAIPTVIKSWCEPETEHPSVFVGGVLGAIITLLTIRSWTFAMYAFPAYILLIDSLILVLIRLGAGKRSLSEVFVVDD